MYSVIQEVLSEEAFLTIGCAVHVSLATLVKDYEPLTEEERKYARNPLTMLIFCCSIRWISSLYWRLKWTELASMRLGANRPTGYKEELYSGEMCCSFAAPPYRRQRRKRENPG